MLSIPLIQSDNHVFKYNRIIKQENTNSQIVNGKIKEEYIEDTNHQNDYSQLLQEGYEYII